MITSGVDFSSISMSSWIFVTPPMQVIAVYFSRTPRNRSKTGKYLLERLLKLERAWALEDSTCVSLIGELSGRRNDDEGDLVLCPGRDHFVQRGKKEGQRLSGASDGFAHHIFVLQKDWDRVLLNDEESC